MAIKSDTITKMRRVKKIFDMIILGMNKYEIIQYTMNNLEWNVTDRTIYNYIGEAETQLRKLAKNDQKKELGKAKRRLDQLYSKSLKNMDVKTALNVVQEASKLLDLYPTEKLDLTSAGKAIKGFKVVIGSPKEEIK